MRNPSCDYTMIAICLFYAIQVAVVVLIEEKGSFAVYNMIGLAVVQLLFAGLFVLDLHMNIVAKGFKLYFSNYLNFGDALAVFFIFIISILELIQDI